MPYLLALTLFLAPTYVIRFTFFHLPTNLLMVWLFLLWAVFGTWLFAKKQVKDFIHFKLSIDKKVLVPTSLFLLAGAISLFIGGIDRQKLGQFIVLFLQPISIFFIAGYIFRQNPRAKAWLLTTTCLLLAIAGLYAILQYFTLMGLPSAWWGNSVEPKRAISFFVHPNFYALWCAPLLALLLPDLGLKIKDLRKNWPFITGWLIGAVGLLLSLSRSGWLGLAVAALVYLIVAADKKIRITILGAALVVIAIVVYYPNLRYRILLPFYGEKSASSRIELWSDGISGIKKSPILGLGLTGFAKQYGALNTDPTLDTHNFPHNIFLDLWLETGLLGLISLIGIMALLIYRGLRGVSPPQDMGRATGEVDLMPLAVSLFLIALLSQGQLDNPYFKNDLALIFWLVLSFII